MKQVFGKEKGDPALMITLHKGAYYVSTALVTSHLKPSSSRSVRRPDLAALPCTQRNGALCIVYLVTGSKLRLGTVKGGDSIYDLLSWTDPSTRSFS